VCDDWTTLHTKLLTYIFKNIFLDADKDCVSRLGYDFFVQLCITRADQYCSFWGLTLIYNVLIVLLLFFS